MASGSVVNRIRIIIGRHPLLRGMVSYAVLWPTGCALQQIIDGKTFATIEWKKCFRFSIFGSLFVAPTLFGWMSFSKIMWPANNLKSAMTRGIVEQFTYGPFAITSFYLGMNLLEFKTLSDGFTELSQKFLPTLRVGVCVWPIIQTINYSLVPEKNRVVYVSIASLLWTTFLAYMKHIEMCPKEQPKVKKTTDS